MYYAKVIETIKTPPSWDNYKVGVFTNINGQEKQIGEYDRNYGLMSTFYPFKQNDKWYALYSKDYTATRVMSLPDCKDLCGEEEDAFGFCPVEYYIPCQNGHSDDPSSYGNWEVNVGKLAGTFGFVAGCIWGDDSSWKVQYLDLSKITEGKLINEPRFGYLELPREYKSLKDCFNFLNFDPTDEDPYITINTPISFHKSGKLSYDLKHIGKQDD